jgi:hypothetical protein
MKKAPACSVGSDDVLQVESKCPYLPITPTYDQYVHQWVTMTEREGFHLKTRSAMKQLFEDGKWMVLQDKMKKCALFKFRVADGNLTTNTVNFVNEPPVLGICCFSAIQLRAQTYNQGVVYCVWKTPQSHPPEFLFQFVE